MGYQLTSVYSITPHDIHSYFIFYIGGQFGDTRSQWIDRNFISIAKTIGPDAVIVRGISDEFEEQFLQTYQNPIETVVFGHDWQREYDFLTHANELIRSYQKEYRELPVFRPFLFVTNINPHLVHNAGNNSIFYLIPLAAF